jgi:protein-tyrosine-phosphatase
MAEHLFKLILEKQGLIDNFIIDSAGIYGEDGCSATEHAKKAAGEYGADMSKHRAKTITREMVENSHLILTMTQRHKEHILKMYPNQKEKVHALHEYASGSRKDVDDPYGFSLEVYRDCAKEIYDTLIQIYTIA